MMKKNEFLGNVIVYGLIAFILVIFVGFGWGIKALLATIVFLLGAYAYFNVILNLVYLIKDRSWKNYRLKLLLYFSLSVVLFVLAFYYFGDIFAIRSFGFAFILFFVQLYFIIKE